MILARMEKNPESSKPNKGLDLSVGSALTVAEEGRGDGALHIERVVVTRSDRPPEPGGRDALERLLARWMVRAYLRQAGECAALPEGTKDLAPVCGEEVA
jgi:hypothetical protein